MDISRQWFKARVGLGATETLRDAAFCSYTILESTPDVMIVPNALEDDRFRENPLVLGAPDIRFYAGSPLKVNGLKVGTLCIIDTKPRYDFGEKEQKMLIDFASIIANLIEERRSKFMQVALEIARITISVLHSVKRPLSVLTDVSRDIYRNWKSCDRKKKEQNDLTFRRHEVKMLNYDVSVMQDKVDILQSLLDLSLKVANRLLDMEQSGIKKPRLVTCDLKHLMFKAEAMVNRCSTSCLMDWKDGFKNSEKQNTKNEIHAPRQVNLLVYFLILI